MKKIIVAIFAVIVALSITLSGCGTQSKQSSSASSQTGAKSGKKLVVGVTLLTRAHDFYKNLEAGMRATADKNGIELKVVDPDFDATRQRQQIQDFINQKVDAIVVCPTDTKAIGTSIQLANTAKIPVFTADIAAQGGEVVCHIASDNKMGGKLMGEYMAKMLKGKGKVLIVDLPTVQSARDRTAGFEEAISKFPGMQIVEKPVPQKGKREEAMRLMQDKLQKYPDLNGIFGVNDDCALGALAAAQQAKRDSVVILGYDAIPEARTNIQKGTPLKADTVQYPDEIGRITIETVAKYLKGDKNIPKQIPVKVGVFDSKSSSGKQ